jgi:hypothetical protein
MNAVVAKSEQWAADSGPKAQHVSYTAVMPIVGACACHARSRGRLGIEEVILTLIRFIRQL